jgi:integrase
MGRKRTGTIQKRGSSFRVRYTDADGIRHWETHPTREAAETALAQKLLEIQQGLQVSSRPNTVLFKELAKDVVTDYQVNGFTSVDDIEARFRVHILPVFQNKRAAQITTAQLKQYILIRQAETPKPANGTINRELEAIRHTFKLAIQGRKLLQMPHVPMLREDNVRSGFFSREEVDRLCSFLPEVLGRFVLFGFLTGWRYGEIQALEWRHVDFVRNEIRLDPGKTKNREGRVFPMTAELRVLLNKQRALATANATPFRSVTNKPMPAAGALQIKSRIHQSKLPAATAQGEAGTVIVMEGAGVATMAARRFVFVVRGRPVGLFRKTWRNACFSAGLPCVVDQEGQPIKALRVFHDLRRSCVKALVAQGIPERVIMQMCGWKSRSVLDRYHIVSEGDLREAARRIDKAEEG